MGHGIGFLRMLLSLKFSHAGPVREIIFQDTQEKGPDPTTDVFLGNERNKWSMKINYIGKKHLCTS